MGGAAPAAAGITPLRWDGKRLFLLDQRRLPEEEVWLPIGGAADAEAAIRSLAVRGAPAIGMAAAYALAVELERGGASDEVLDAAALRLGRARPTAANLAWAVRRVAAAARAVPAPDRAGTAAVEAELIDAENTAATERMAGLGADLLAGAHRVLTHCNSGPLAAGGCGTGVGVIAELAARADVSVLCCETRPLLQGARLTTWELQRLGVNHRVIVDAAAAGLIARGEVDAVVVGFDRAAANGDVANKVGTYAHALAAHAAGVPLVFVGPASSVDLATATGGDIEIELRDPEEVTHASGARTTPGDTEGLNPAFDVTPAHLVHAVVTEHGVARPVDEESMRSVAAPQ